MKSLKTPLLVSSALLLAMTSAAFGEAGISYNASGAPADVTANVKFKINVPEIIILRVGDWGKTSNTNTVTWDYNFGAGLTSPTANGAATSAHWTAITATAPAAQDASSDDETETDKAGDGALKVAVFSNTGDVRLKAETVTDFAAVSAGYNKPSLSEISATSSNISHTALNGFAGGTVDLANAAGLVQKTDTWAYKYTPTVNPAAGTYNAEVKYTLANI